MESLKILIFLVYFFQIIVNINGQKYVPKGRYLHTATLVGTKIYFLGGGLDAGGIFYTNDFFYLDISESFDKTKGALPFVNISDKSSEIPKHYAATTTVFGELKDSIFFFGGNMTNYNGLYTLMRSFNATESEWNMVTVSQGNTPKRREHARAVTDNNDKIYIFGGVFIDFTTYSIEMTIFDTVNKIWSTGVNGIGRIGHTATFLPDTKEIIYIGGFNLDGNNNSVLLDITNVCKIYYV